jgi:hypothetical protein
MTSLKLIGTALALVLFLSDAAFTQSYRTHQQQMTHFQQLARSSDAARFVEYGTSAGGRSLFALEIGRGNLSEKPGLLVVAGVEPDDLAGTEAASAYAEYLLNNARVDSVSRLLDKYAVYVIPRASPDALEGYFASPRVARQGNDEKQDNDRDGLFDEDGPEDLNRDGHITMMRVLHDQGTHNLHPEVPFLLREADMRKGEVGRYLLMMEGRDNDGDGRINEDAPGGVNLNRNMTYEYVPYTSEGGLHPFSSPEASALGHYLLERRNIVSVFTFGPHDNIKNPWSIKWPERREASNQFMADSVAYRVAVGHLSPHLKYSRSGNHPGDVARWAYWHGGRYSFSAPAWVYPAAPDSVVKENKITGVLTEPFNAMYWMGEHYTEGLLEWQTIQHSDFPDHLVEVGGFAPFVHATPPASQLETIRDAAIPMLFTLTGLLPVLEVDQPRVESLGGDVYRVRLTLRNSGTLSTVTNTGIRVLAMPYVTSRLSLADGQRILNGHRVTTLPEPIPGGGSHLLEYTIMGRGEVSIRVGAPTTGFREMNINLR